ncbi:MAG TPA: cell division protein FtsQ/DivIB [Flavobacteriaceae bacterium]|nr:cell division protein FtsQ/DivIB [Flavobacteriaceae bacterium]MCB9213087.1 hypothetical protein [Alteromonas sp.]HPF10992.1 cell division protein FtsQ/DivIB [Flavobacteriaceae bacterium]HQU20266.1 cell division protein FtsQ/DivIB [Flavobacteriaceae bacterium]HQU64158.1 cell division protein FtsQ/DivIB [Flavobacteriaceae bacterium]
MRGKWNIVKLLILLVLTGVLFSFANKRNGTRKLTDIDVQFTDLNSPFITISAVNKLLIQNNDSVTSIPKETLVLNEMESRLLQNPMVRDAQVFVTIDGRLGAKIEQRNPIARVATSAHFYIDEDGKKMPLSSVYSARVPLITGSSGNNFEELMPLLHAVRKDVFMNEMVTGLEEQNDGRVLLFLRKQDFKVLFGKPENMAKKFQNFKAFFQKATKENKLTNYRLVNLEFGNQVVATKK